MAFGSDLLRFLICTKFPSLVIYVKILLDEKGKFQAARAELEAAQRAAVEGSELSKAEASIRAEVSI